MRSLKNNKKGYVIKIKVETNKQIILYKGYLLSVENEFMGSIFDTYKTK